MIATQELMRLRGEWQLDIGVIEKDYVRGCVLAAIAAESAIADTWIFKGGTCLCKCSSHSPRNTSCPSETPRDSRSRTSWDARAWASKR